MFTCAGRFQGAGDLIDDSLVLEYGSDPYALVYVRKNMLDAFIDSFIDSTGQNQAGR